MYSMTSEVQCSEYVWWQKKNACGFKCPTVAACRHLWKCAVEQGRFYTCVPLSVCLCLFVYVSVCVCVSLSVSVCVCDTVMLLLLVLFSHSQWGVRCGWSVTCREYSMYSRRTLAVITVLSVLLASSRVATCPAFVGTSRFLAFVSRVHSPTSAGHQLSRFLVVPCPSCRSLPLHHSKPVEFRTKSMLAHAELYFCACNASYNVATPWYLLVGAVNVLLRIQENLSAAGAPPQTPLKELTALPQTP